MRKIIILQGLPASGKTTWAKKQCLESDGKIKRINKDDLRDMLDAGKWSKTNEELILRVRDIIAQESLIKGFDVIIDDTNLHHKHVEKFKQMQEVFSNVLNTNIEIEIKSFLNVSLDECIKRDAKRENSVGKNVIVGMYNSFIK